MSQHDNRWVRSRGKTKRVVLQARDYTMLRLLFDHGYLTSAMLHAFVSRDVKRPVFSRRLKDLWLAHYIDRPHSARIENLGSSRASMVYELTPRGIQALMQVGKVTAEEAVWRTAFMRQKYRELWHDLNSANITASIRLAVERTPGLRFITPFSILKNAPAETRASSHPFSVRLGEHYIVPDYLFGIAHTVNGGERYRFYWFEQDQATEQMTERKNGGSSFERKLKDCNTLISSKLYLSHFDLDGIDILTVTIAPGRLPTMLRVAEELPTRRKFLFKAVNAASETNRVPKPVPHILTEDWARAGLPPAWLHQQEEGGDFRGPRHNAGSREGAGETQGRDRR